jgi:hypothetical protein
VADTTVVKDCSAEKIYVRGQLQIKTIIFCYIGNCIGRQAARDSFIFVEELRVEGSLANVDVI